MRFVTADGLGFDFFGVAGQALFVALEQVAQPQTNEITLDLPEQRISLRNGEQIDFNIDELSKLSLLNGLDAIGNTLRYSDDIRQFQQTHLQNNPWLA